MKWVCIAICMSVLVGTSQAASKCYLCFAPYCNEPFVEANSTVQDCPTGATVCAKAKVNDQVLVRGCVQTSDCTANGGTNNCLHGENNGQTADACCCTGDLCNSAPKRGVSALVVMLTTVLAKAAF